MDDNFPLVSNFGFNPSFDYEYANDLNHLGFGDYSLGCGFSSEIESPIHDGDFSNTVLNYINQMLMEEDMDSKPCMFHDPLALQAAEKSLYEVLGPNSDDGFSAGVTALNGNVSNVGVSANSFSRIDRVVMDLNGSGVMDGSSSSDVEVPESIGVIDLMSQFKKGLEEGNKFLPKGSQLVINAEDYRFSPEAVEKLSSLLVKAEKEEREHSPDESRERKNHERDETDLEEEGGRSNKHFAVYTEDSEEENELAELFDKVLLCDRGNPNSERRWLKIIESNEKGEANKCVPPLPSTQSMRSNRTRAKTQDGDKEVVDLWTLLISCAQAVSVSDFRAANELLNQIRQHSSPLGDGFQRTAHCLANGLEARLAGTGSEIYAALAYKRTSATDMLKAYQAYIQACPFKKISIIYTNIMIYKKADKAEKLHIVDFGILYGFQWPAFIYYLSKRSGGPPKLRITGIEPPQHGFRPTERVEETGHRLARYCQRFGVPFEYDFIAKKFEDVKIVDFRIEKDEVLAVSCLLRFKNLLDETVIVDSPRDSVLSLIRRLNPDIFVHSINNGSYTAPFFVPRFREALFNFSSVFDLADATFTREDPMRLMFEKEFIGREIINVVACEGTERVERPETYKQWQVRTTRAGFRPLPLDSEAVRKLKGKVKRRYHSDFTVEEDGNWMLQGWKGRVLYASSCWVPL